MVRLKCIWVKLNWLCVYIYAYTYNLKKSSQLYEEMGGHEKSWLTGRRTEKYYSYMIYWKINHLNEKCKDNIKKEIHNKKTKHKDFQQ